MNNYLVFIMNLLNLQRKPEISKNTREKRIRLVSIVYRQIIFLNKLRKTKRQTHE